jgi:hypothetical protein
MGPPPCIRRHRYFGVLAPNSPLRTSVTALAPGATIAPPAPIAEPVAEPAHRRAARYAWALLLVRIHDRRKSLWDEVFPLRCTHCGAETRIIAFINDASTVRDLLVHRGEPTAPPRIAPARGPPLWDLPEPERVTSTPTPSRHPSTRSINALLGNPDRRPPAACKPGRRVPVAAGTRRAFAGARQTPRHAQPPSRGDAWPSVLASAWSSQALLRCPRLRLVALDLLSLARARPPWPPRPPGSATTSVRSRPLPQQIDT